MLGVSRLRVSFGRFEALGGIDLDVADGERVGLVGPNGSGKTTLLDAISGLVRPASGGVAIGGRPTLGFSPDAIARLGVARCFQTPRLFERMTVLLNARAGQYGRGGTAGDGDEPLGLLERCGLGPLRDRLAAELPPAARRRLELARALAARPRLLLLDEPCSGLAAAETEEAVALLQWAASGRTLVIVEHRLPVLRRLCSRLVVLDRGRIVADGSPATVEAGRALTDAYLGRRV
ncbi:MAG: ATP-binding cassette domain-containing protein [Candidatus Rokubacteria bacterium]|nr:ATP-binding cassette domain-containing protein [Candidatus Rokubacteria bacterium]